MSDKAKTMIGLGITGTVIFLIVFFATGTIIEGKLGFFELTYAAILLFLVGGSTLVFVQRNKDLKKGVAIEDELSKKVFRKAGSQAYFASVWIAVGLLWYNGFITDNSTLKALSMAQTLGLMIILPGAIFIGLAFIYSKKGEVE